MQVLTSKLVLDLDKLDETLKCSICLGRMRDPIYLKPVSRRCSAVSCRIMRIMPCLP